MPSAKHKKILLSAIVSLAVIGLFFAGHYARADWATDIATGLLSIFIWALGLILVLVIQGLIFIASYQTFINAQAVILGWVIVRDICNMFFVVILMIIAFGTILHLENYNYKKWLPKLILMAILINFSKTICGLLIDVSQVVMLTFVNAFKDIGGANLTDMLGISRIVTMAKAPNGDNSFSTIVGAYILGVVYLLVAIVVITTMMAILAMRLVIIWIYIVLSPAAYLLAAFPGGQKYASQWWDEFTKNLIVGPVLAFFIWLSLAALSGANNLADSQTFSNADSSAIQGASGMGGSSSTVNNIGTQAGSPGALISFVIGIGMLIGGLKISQEIGGAAGSIAGSGMSALQKGKGMATGAAMKGLKGVGKFAGNKLGDVRDIASEKMGIDLNLAAVWKRRNEQSEANRQLRLQRIRKGTLATAAGDVRADGTTPSWLHRKMALASTGDVAWQNIIDKKHRILTAGSPKVKEKTKAEIGNAEDGTGQLGEKKRAEERIKALQTESKRVVSQDEYNVNIDRARELEHANTGIDARRQAITTDPAFADLEKKERTRTITASEQTELDKKREEISRLDDSKRDNTEEANDLRSRDTVYTRVADRDAERDRIAGEITNEANHISEVETEIKRLTAVLTKNKLSEITSARTHVDATLEAEANKKLGSTTNSDQLVSIIEEAMHSGDQGLVAAAYKRITKTGNYNDIHRALNLGTGHEGMLGMAEKLQTDAGFSQQDARALVQEIGEIAKSVNHYQAFAPMTMDKAGDWQPTSEDEQQAAIFGELSKVQIQKIVRDLNRLAAGEFQSGKPHTAENWILDKSMIATIAAKDHAFADQLQSTGAISMIQFIGSNPENIEKLIRNGGKETAKLIKELTAAAGKNKVTNPLETMRTIV